MSPPAVSTGVAAGGGVAGAQGAGGATEQPTSVSGSTAPVSDAMSGATLLDAFRSLLTQMTELVSRLSAVLTAGQPVTPVVTTTPDSATTTPVDGSGAVTDPTTTPTVAVGDPPVAPDAAPAPTTTTTPGTSSTPATQTPAPGDTSQSSAPVNHDPSKDATYIKLKQRVESDTKLLASTDAEIIKQQSRIDNRRRDLAARRQWQEVLRGQLDELKASAWYQGKFGQEDRALAVAKAKELESNIAGLVADAHRIEIEINGLVRGMQGRVVHQDELRIKLRNDRIEMEQRAKVVRSS